MAPTPASAHGTTAPTAKYREATATPRSPVTGSKATIENVAFAGTAGTRTNVSHNRSLRMSSSVRYAPSGVEPDYKPPGITNPGMAIRHAAVLASAWMVVAAGPAVAAPRTMRLDYYHSGNDKQEMFSVDRVVIEPLEWPGNLEKTIDRTNLGKYFLEVRDPGGRVLYVTRLRLDLRRMGNHRRSQDPQSHVPRVGPFPRP